MKKFKDQALSFFESGQRKKIIFLFFLMGLASILELLSLGMILPITSVFLDSSKFVYGEYINNIVNHTNINIENIIYYLLFIFFIFYILKIATLLYISWYQQHFLYKLKYSLSNRFYFNYINENYSFYKDKNTASFIRNIMSEVDNLINFYLGVVTFSLEIIIVLTISIFLIFINPMVTLVAFSFFSIVALIYFTIIKNRISSWGYQRQNIEAKRIQYLQEGFGAFKEIKIMGRENYFYRNFENQTSKFASISLKINFLNQIPRHLFDFVAILMIISIFLFLKITGYSFNETFSLLALYLAAAFRFIPATNRLLYSLQTMKFFYPSVEILSNDLKNFSQKDKKIVQADEKKFIFNNTISVQIKNFKYSNNDNFSLKNIEFDIPKYKKIGIIGTSGSGKSTLIENISGILKPEKGDIKVDGISIFNNRREWMKNIGYIPQKIFILDDTLKNNILFGADPNLFDDDYIVGLLKKINLDHLLFKLRNGLNHNLGEKGINLSVGEIQRVGIGRALLSDPEIIILDEATSSLDTFTESKILDELYKFKNKTFISVAHRIGTLRKSDIIYRVEEGKIVSQGPFNKFMET